MKGERRKRKKKRKKKKEKRDDQSSSHANVSKGQRAFNELLTKSKGD
tara:strand:- start:397 stop:537 length:141 start_codon:yes stop_codon:yes gene_type:complete